MSLCSLLLSMRFICPSVSKAMSALALLSPEIVIPCILAAFVILSAAAMKVKSVQPPRD